MLNPNIAPFRSLLSEIAISIVKAFLWELNQECKQTSKNVIKRYSWMLSTINYPIYRDLLTTTSKVCFNTTFTEYRWRIVPEVIEHYNPRSPYLTLDKVQKIKKLRKYHNPQFCFEILQTYFIYIGNVNLVIQLINYDLEEHIAEVYTSELTYKHTELMQKRYILFDITKTKYADQLHGSKLTPYFEVTSNLTIFLLWQELNLLIMTFIILVMIQLITKKVKKRLLNGVCVNQYLK